MPVDFNRGRCQICKSVFFAYLMAVCKLSVLGVQSLIQAAQEHLVFLIPDGLVNINKNERRIPHCSHSPFAICFLGGDMRFTTGFGTDD
jgi:hypothetical protein